jgi:hypothetical protein
LDGTDWKRSQKRAMTEMRMPERMPERKVAARLGKEDG